MGKFNSVQDVLKEFQARSGNTDRIDNHAGVRYSDIVANQGILERLLETDYNKVSGYSFSEIMEAMSTVATNYGSRNYVEACNATQGTHIQESALTSKDADYFTINEGFEAATPALAPFPVPAVALTMYAYERSVTPFLAHIFDLKGNRGLVYYQRIEADTTKGNITKKDLLGSPKEMPKQPVGFVGNKAIDVEVASATTGTTTYKFNLAGAPIQPGTVVIKLDGAEGYLMDFATPAAVRNGVQAMVSVNGQLGNATIKYADGEVNVTLATAPTAGKKLRATYVKDIETAETASLGKVHMTLDSKQLVAENFGVQIDTNVYQEALSRAMFGLDWNTEVDNALATLYNKEIANKIVTEIKAKIPAMSLATHDISNGIKDATNHLGGNNALFNTQFIAVVLGKLRKLIANASGNMIQKVSALAINIDVLPIIQALPGWEEANAMFEEAQGGMVLVGTFKGIPVIVGYDPILTQGEVVAIYKSATRAFLAPYAFGQFILPIIRDVYDPNNLAINHKQLIASAAGDVVAERLAAKLTITGIDDVI